MYLYILFISLFLTISAQADTHKPQQFLDSITGKPQEGEQIVKHYCANCHAKTPLISLGAPPIGDTEAWMPRLKQDFDSLFKHTDEGLRAMPARGGCFECTDQQLILAIIALLPETAKKTFFTPKKAH